ncbi:MAG: hypothetical protein RR821_07850 [Clostridia bacterium]
MLKKINCDLIFICLLCLSLYSQAAVAEKVNTETGISYCMQSVFVQGNMYIVSDNGIWMRQLSSGNEEMIVSLQRIQTAWGISSTFSLFARNNSFGIVDWENGKIWMWEDGEFVLLSDLGANILIDESQRMSCVSAGDLLWVLTSGKLLTVSTITGEMKMSHISGVQEINSYSDTGILIVYSTNGTREICSVSSLSEPPFFLAELPNSVDGGIAFDSSSQTLYAVVSGMLSRLEQGKWIALSPLSRSSTWETCCIWNDGMLYVDQYSLGFVPFDRVTESIQLTITGINPYMDTDQQYMRENDNIVICRNTVDHFCAEEIYRYVSTGDTDTDLFLVRMSTGIRSLMERGYLLPLSSSEALVQNANRLYTWASSSCQMDEMLYAFPIALRNVEAWKAKSDYKNLVVPSSINALIASAKEWDTEGNDIPYIAVAYNQSGWTKKDYAAYVLKQYILTNDERNLSFGSPDFVECLREIAELPELASNALSNSADDHTACTAVLVSHYSTNLNGAEETEGHLVLPPPFHQDADVSIPADILVYVANPNGKHVKETIAYIEYQSQNLSLTQQAFLFQGAAAVMNPSIMHEKEEAQQAIDDAQRVLDSSLLENRRTAEDRLNNCKATMEQILCDDTIWIVHPIALETYQTQYAPRISLQLTPLLERENKSHVGLWQTLNDILEKYIQRQINIEQFSKQMDQVLNQYRMESEFQARHTTGGEEGISQNHQMPS